METTRLKVCIGKWKRQLPETPAHVAYARRRASVSRGGQQPIQKKESGLQNDFLASLFAQQVFHTKIPFFMHERII